MQESWLGEAYRMADYCPQVPWEKLAQHAERPWCDDARFQKYHGDAPADLLRLYLDLEDSQLIEGQRLVFKTSSVERWTAPAAESSGKEGEGEEAQESEKKGGDNDDEVGDRQVLP